MNKEIEPFRWMTSSITGLLLMIINGYILKNEMRKIKLGTARFATPTLKLWSILCISTGVIVGLSLFLHYFPGFCYLAPLVAAVGVLFQPIFIGFYQLSRIYYCFSRNKVYSHKGYSNGTFIIMYTFGVVLAINVIIHEVPGAVYSVCGINAKYQFQYVRYVRPSIIWTLWLATTSFFYLLWDICTLLLYLLKIRSFRKYKAEDVRIYKRIVSILYRVLIPTIFYEIMSLLAIIFVMVRNFLLTANGFVVLARFLNYFLMDLSMPIMYSYSISLMSEHNTSRYIKFLKFLHFFKLYFLCCCCRHIVIEQLNELNVNGQLNNVVNENENAKKKEDVSIELDTHDISENHGKIQGKGLEFSVETTIKN